MTNENPQDQPEKVADDWSALRRLVSAISPSSPMHAIEYAPLLAPLLLPLSMELSSYHDKPWIRRALYSFEEEYVMPTFQALMGWLCKLVASCGGLADWLLFLALCVALTVLRPLTTPGVSLQQRYVVVVLILGSWLTWLGWCCRLWIDRDPVMMMVVVGLLALAGYLRIGWTKKGGTP